MERGERHYKSLRFFGYLDGAGRDDQHHDHRDQRGPERCVKLHGDRPTAVRRFSDRPFFFVRAATPQVLLDEVDRVL